MTRKLYRNIDKLYSSFCFDYVTLVGLKLRMILLPLSLECWDFRCEQPLLALRVIFFKIQDISLC